MQITSEFQVAVRGLGYWFCLVRVFWRVYWKVCQQSYSIAQVSLEIMANLLPPPPNDVWWHGPPSLSQLVCSLDKDVRLLINVILKVQFILEQRRAIKKVGSQYFWTYTTKIWPKLMGKKILTDSLSFVSSNLE